MAHGLEVYSSTGATRLSVSDRLTRLHATESQAYWTSGANPRFFPVTGMVDDGTWMLILPWGHVVGWIGTGGYYIKLIYSATSGTFPVSIYRC